MARSEGTKLNLRRHLEKMTMQATAFIFDLTELSSDADVRPTFDLRAWAFFRFSVFGFLSAFGFRVSDFE
jgi:hypothetical protein